MLMTSGPIAPAETDTVPLRPDLLVVVGVALLLALKFAMVNFSFGKLAAVGPQALIATAGLALVAVAWTLLLPRPARLAALVGIDLLAGLVALGDVWYFRY